MRNQPKVYLEDPLSWFPRLSSKFHTFWLKHTLPFAYFGPGTRVDRDSKISRSAAPFISIGTGVGIARGVQLDVCAPIQTQSPVLVIDEGCWLQRRTVIAARNHVHLMPHVMCAHSVLITDGPVSGMSDRALNYSDSSTCGTVVIEEGCWIGFGVKIIAAAGDLRIGRHSIIAANTIINDSIPPYSVVAGNPPRIMRQFDTTRGRWVAGCVRIGVERRSRTSPRKFSR